MGGINFAWLVVWVAQSQTAGLRLFSGA